MDLLSSFGHREEKLLAGLREHQSAFDDPNGKGESTESLVEEALIRPYLPPEFECGKGTVVQRLDRQSPAIDRVIWTRAYCPPLVHAKGHSIFPVECVAGGVEITMSLNATKLRTDMERLAAMRAMRRIRLWESIPESRTAVRFLDGERDIGCRAFIIGYPSDPTWRPLTIAETFLRLQQEFKTLIMGLYVLGIGYFETTPPAPEDKRRIRIKAYEGDDRLFRFGSSLRWSMEGWVRRREQVYVGDYVADSGGIILSGDVPSEEAIVSEGPEQTATAEEFSRGTPT
jgi:hypothetical protein